MRVSATTTKLLARLRLGTLRETYANGFKGAPHAQRSGRAPWYLVMVQGVDGIHCDRAAVHIVGSCPDPKDPDLAQIRYPRRLRGVCAPRARVAREGGRGGNRRCAKSEAPRRRYVRNKVINATRFDFLPAYPARGKREHIVNGVIET